MKRIAALAAFALVCLTVAAQGPGSGPGYGPGGPGPGCGPNDTQPACAGGGPGYGRGTRGPMSPGWSMMTPEERNAHHDKMRNFKDAAECEAYMNEHHKLMQERAQQRNQRMLWNGPRPYCEYLKKPA